MHGVNDQTIKIRIFHGEILMVDKIELEIIQRLNLMTRPRRNYAIIIAHKCQAPCKWHEIVSKNVNPSSDH